MEEQINTERENGKHMGKEEDERNVERKCIEGGKK
jgi:hypothetical protein